jgi:hypothetical protein
MPLGGPGRIQTAATFYSVIWLKYTVGMKAIEGIGVAGLIMNIQAFSVEPSKKS